MKFSIPTKGFNDVVDITDKVRGIIEESDIQDGLVLVFTPHQTSCAIIALENESGLIADLKKFLEKLAPLKGNYHHNQAWGEGNAAAHLLAALLGPDLLIPLEKSRLLLGTWQRIILIDSDNRSRQREVIVKIIPSLKDEL